jgi:hypothetical protein
MKNLVFTLAAILSSTAFAGDIETVFKPYQKEGLNEAALVHTVGAVTLTFGTIFPASREAVEIKTSDGKTRVAAKVAEHIKKWDDADKACTDLGGDWRLPSFADVYALVFFGVDHTLRSDRFEIDFRGTQFYPFFIINEELTREKLTGTSDALVLFDGQDEAKLIDIEKSTLPELTDENAPLYVATKKLKRGISVYCVNGTILN